MFQYVKVDEYCKKGNLNRIRLGKLGGLEGVEDRGKN